MIYNEVFIICIYIFKTMRYKLDIFNPKSYNRLFGPKTFRLTIMAHFSIKMTVLVPFYENLHFWSLNHFSWHFPPKLYLNSNFSPKLLHLSFPAFICKKLDFWPNFRKFYNFDPKIKNFAFLVQFGNKIIFNPWNSLFTF